VANGVAGEAREQRHDARVDGLQVRVLDSVAPRDLARHELRVEPQVDVRGPQAQRLLERELDGGPLRVVVGADPEELGDLGQRLPRRSIAQDGTRPGGAGIAARGAIGVDQNAQLVSRLCRRAAGMAASRPTRPR
jgi:hypothetical protein